MSYTEEEEARVVKRAAEIGIANTFQYFQKKFPDRPLKEATVRTWVGKYKIKLSKRVAVANHGDNSGEKNLSICRSRSSSQKKRSSIFAGRRAGSTSKSIIM